MIISHEGLSVESPSSRATTWGILRDDVITQPERRQPTQILFTPDYISHQSHPQISNTILFSLLITK